jgi:hypothetical protein
MCLSAKVGLTDHRKERPRSFSRNQNRVYINGAIAELWAKTTKPPRPIRITIIGVIHHHLLFQKNEIRSPIIPK